MSHKWTNLWTSLFLQSRDTFAAGMAYEERKPDKLIIAQSGSVASLERPYANPWYHVTAPPEANSRMWAIACKCSTPQEVIGQTLRPYTFRNVTIMLAQCSFCQRIYWSE